jgi:hypothetical protein
MSEVIPFPHRAVRDTSESKRRFRTAPSASSEQPSADEQQAMWADSVWTGVHARDKLQLALAIRFHACRTAGESDEAMRARWANEIWQQVPPSERFSWALAIERHVQGQ